jgi:uncharacterized protein YndB with AHSA1/START domain
MTDVTLQLERTFPAPAAEVYEAWTDPDVLRRWFAAGPDWDTPVAEADVRVGGRYRVTMRNPGTGDEHTVAGVYEEVVPGERLVYTWAWEDGAEPESTVTVEFRDAGDSSTVVLTQVLATAESRDQHTKGWNGCLDNLERRVISAGTRS